MTVPTFSRTATPPAQAGSPPKRKIRNYLLDPRFQLKYAGLLVGVAMILMTALGTVIWRTASVASQQARTAADQAERAMRESQTSSRLLRMQQISAAADNPELVRTMEEQLAQFDREAEANVLRVRQQRVEIERTRRRMIYTLVGSALALMVLLGAVGIVITHKVVGPVYKLKRLLRLVGSGRFDIHERLRRGDELEDLFTTFLEMCRSLREHQRAELSQLEEAIREVEAAGVSAATLQKLFELRDQMRASIGNDEASCAPRAA